MDVIEFELFELVQILTQGGSRQYRRMKDSVCNEKNFIHGVRLSLLGLVINLMVIQRKGAEFCFGK